MKAKMQRRLYKFKRRMTLFTRFPCIGWKASIGTERIFLHYRRPMNYPRFVCCGEHVSITKMFAVKAWVLVREPAEGKTAQIAKLSSGSSS